MINRFVVIPLVILLCFAIGCQKEEEAAGTPTAKVEADVAAIKATLDEWMRLYNAGEFEKLVSAFYTEDAVLMTPNVPIRKGKEAILLGYQETSKLNDEHCDSTVVEDVRVSGDLAVARGIDTGTTTPKGGGEPARYSLKWLIVLERQSDGAWKWTHEIWNENLPFPEKPAK